MASNASKTSKGKSQEQIIAGFQELRQQQRMLASKISEIEMDMKEHELVAETLKEVDANRKCYRMVGGVLVERTVSDVLPALINNKEQMAKLIESFKKKLEAKGADINKYRETHDVKIRGEESRETTDQQKESKPGGVLVANDS
ncbi:prefoldin subunit 2-like [Gigantopelta aegis]|uniref:prefoldin subunit 2-like n=1 Tax=Gigantopelta aegis TaxID=1735272 RepID=UPI001B88A4AF|nr:prefoldin subunit 2-like [Gigantopelta aegis]